MREAVRLFTIVQKSSYLRKTISGLTRLLKKITYSQGYSRNRNLSKKGESHINSAGLL